MGRRGRRHRPTRRMRRIVRRRPRHLRSRRPRIRGRRRRTMKGGWAPLNTGGWRSEAAGPIGCAWGSKPGTWPGVFASAGGDSHGATVSNHFGLSPSGVGPATPPISTRNTRPSPTGARMGGSRRTRRSKGGSRLRPFLPQALANSIWQAGATMSSLSNGWKGKVTPAAGHPSVLNQPIDRNYTYIASDPIDVKQIHLDAANAAARL